jgi:hypothetical protein
VALVTYLGTTVTDQNLIQEEINTRLNSGKLLSSHLLSENVKVRIFKTITFLVVV